MGLSAVVVRRDIGRNKSDISGDSAGRRESCEGRLCCAVVCFGRFGCKGCKVS